MVTRECGAEPTPLCGATAAGDSSRVMTVTRVTVVTIVTIVTIITQQCDGDTLGLFGASALLRAIKGVL